MAIKVLDAGLLTTVQDLGRPGYQKDGVSVGGAVDRRSLRLANLLVGNHEGEAGLEMTLHGPTLLFEKDALIAVTGSDLAHFPMWRPVFIKSGSVIKFSPIKSGCRSYLAVAGGIDVPAVMGSKSTHLQAGIGGMDGRAVAKNDYIKIGDPTHFMNSVRWSISPFVRPKYRDEVVLHITPGPERDFFSDKALDTFFTESYKVTSQSNRMGFRLQGPSLEMLNDNDLLSSPVSAGTIQVPPNGMPIILMAECQTTGGYPRIGHVIQADFPLLSQVKPGDTIQFRPITLEEAHQRYFDQEKELRFLKRAIRMRCEHGSN